MTYKWLIAVGVEWHAWPLAKGTILPLPTSDDPIYHEDWSITPFPTRWEPDQMRDDSETGEDRRDRKRGEAEV